MSRTQRVLRQSRGGEGNDRLTMMEPLRRGSEIDGLFEAFPYADTAGRKGQESQYVRSGNR